MIDDERLQEYKEFYFTYKDAHLHDFEQEEVFTKFLELITALEDCRARDAEWRKGIENEESILAQTCDSLTIENADLRKQLEEARKDIL